MISFNFYVENKITTVIRCYDGVSAIKLYDKMLNGEIYENYTFSTNRKLNRRDEYIFIFDYLDCYGEELKHPTITITNASDMRRVINGTYYDKVVIE